jgi:hypothetical protein
VVNPGKENPNEKQKKIKTINMVVTRFDFIFSYWVVILSILHIFHFIKYNPLPLLIIGILLNVIEFILMIYYKNTISHIITFSILSFTMKIIPYLYMKNDIITRNDIINSILLIIIYFLWLHINNVNILEFLKSFTSGIKENKPNGPFTYYVDKVYADKP